MGDFVNEDEVLAEIETDKVLLIIVLIITWHTFTVCNSKFMHLFSNGNRIYSGMIVDPP